MRAPAPIENWATNCPLAVRIRVPAYVAPTARLKGSTEPVRGGVRNQGIDRPVGSNASGNAPSQRRGCHSGVGAGVACGRVKPVSRRSRTRSACAALATKEKAASRVVDWETSGRSGDRRGKPPTRGRSESCGSWRPAPARSQSADAGAQLPLLAATLFGAAESSVVC
jgi:hypothetical protein